MNASRFLVEHVCLTTDRPFDDVAKAFARLLGQFDQNVLDSPSASADTDAAKAKIEALAGPSGFMLFGTVDHGSLLILAGEKRKAVQCLVGNPLIALQMTQLDIRASLYSPLRVLLYENEDGKTRLEYDKPSTLFGQFGNAEIATVAAMLDRKLEALAAAVIR
jgi:uncharacterized protein (DUF302 family)